LLNYDIFLCTAAAAVPDIFPVLHKARSDNVKEYVEKKRLWLAEKQRGQKDDIETTVDDHVVAKRHKVTADI